jgi:zinc protease
MRITVLALLLSIAAAAQNLPSGITKFTSVEGITEYRLSNGLRVLLFPDPTKNTATVNMTYLVGSRHEGYGETGMAHLLEHLVFKGTPRHPNIAKELTDHGTRPNGSTFFDRTNYFESFQATPENLAWAIDLEADRMINSFIAKKDLDSEMTVVRNEFEMGENDPTGVLFERMLSSAFLWHNYGNTTIGARSDIEKVRIENLQAFYRRYYQPDNAVLLVAGKIEEGATLALIAKHFGPIPKPTRELPSTWTEEPTQDGERSVTLRRVGDTQVVGLVYHAPAGPHPDSAALQLAHSILTDTPSGRLHKGLLETKKAAGVFGFNFQGNEPGFAMFLTQLRKEQNLEEVRDIMLRTVEGFAATPVTKEELDRIRQGELKEIELALNNSERVGLTMSEYIAQGDWRLFFLLRDRLREAKLEAVQAAALRYFKPSNRTLGLFIPTEKPERAEIPTAPLVSELVKDYKGGAAVAMGEAFDASPANIDKRTARGDVAGMKLAMLSKKTRGESVNARIVLRLGNLQALQGKGSVPALTAAMLMRGTTTRSRQQIQDELDRLKARVGVGPDEGGVAVTIQTTRPNLLPVLDLVADVLRNPAFANTEFEQLKQERIAQFEEQKSDPTAIAMSAAMQHIMPYPLADPRHVNSPEESIAATSSVTLASLQQFHKDFYGASGGTLTFIGDFDAEAMQKKVSTAFTGWKSKVAYERVQMEAQPVSAVARSFQTPDKSNAIVTAVLSTSLKDSDPDYAAVTFGNFLFGGGFLSSRLATRIRQKDGLSYGVGSQFRGRPEEKMSLWQFYAICAPENAPKVEAAFKDELAKMLKDGFTEQEVKDGKAGWVQSRQVSRGQDNELTGSLSGMLPFDRTMQFAADFEARVAALTPQQILEAMRRHLAPEKISYFRGGDFARVKAAF